MSRSGRIPRRLVLIVPVVLIGALLAVALLTSTGTEPSLRTPERPISSPATSGPGTTAGTDERPNVVVVLSDDQRTETVARMPNVQSLLAAKGTSFGRAQVPTPLCCPSRASLLTGRYAHDTGVWSNGRPDGGWWVVHESGLEDRTVAVALHKAGYRTGLVGKYFNSFAKWSDADYTPPGWDTFLAFRTPAKSGGYYNYALSDGTARGTRIEDYSTDVLAQAAEEFIRSTPSEQPLFLYFAPYAPHAPARPAPRHRGAWAGRILAPKSLTEDLRDKPQWVRRQRSPGRRALDLALSRQQESLMAVDEAVARLVGALDDTARLANTLVVYLSDNGLLLGEHGLVGKGAPYDPAVSVPMLLRWDGRVEPGARDQRLALNLDVTATIAAATSVPYVTDGLSLLGPRRRAGFVLEGAADTKVGRPAFCGWRSVDWTYVRWATGEEELYSQRTDQNQLRNLALDALQRPRLLSMRATARRHCRPEPPDFDW